MAVAPVKASAFDMLAARFVELPKHCGTDAAPGIDEVEEWRDWTAIETTPDQRRIEDFVSRYNLRDAVLLHIGVGNSELAKRFAPGARAILGTTISAAEHSHGEQLRLPNYLVFINNKYSGIPVPGDDVFDFIIDNNPTTFGCCVYHLDKMMSEYRRRLKDTGMIVTDRQGLGWIVSTEGANPRWKFDYADWTALGRAYGLRPERVDDFVYVLAGKEAEIRRQKGLRTLRGAVRKLARMLRGRLAG
jgi:hypothetical protein